MAALFLLVCIVPAQAAAFGAPTPFALVSLVPDFQSGATTRPKS
jgi:hypothetical protein